jgi:3-(3-hydroxy-phenyl)propionate hydroxylase
MQSHETETAADRSAAKSADHEIVVVGGGPTGLMLASELAIAGIDVALVERRMTQGVPGTRALGLLPRAVETLDLRGIGELFVAAGTTHPTLNFHIPLDVSRFPSKRNYLLGLVQNDIERLLADWAATLPITFYRGETATGLQQSENAVCITLGSGSYLTGRYVAGCDGGRSMVRKSANIGFEGWPASTSWVMAEALMESEPEWGFHTDDAGEKHVIVKGDTPGHVRLVLVEHAPDLTREPTLADVSRTLHKAYGSDFGIHSPVWVSRFTDMARQATHYRSGRVLIAGDAAHVHAPLGGQGLGIGLQDAANLGWKLAQVVKGISPASLLDTYEKERHPVAAQVLQSTLALSALRRPDAQSQALGRYFAELLAMDEPHALMTAEVSGLGTAYDLGAGHPLAGRRMPDIDLHSGDGSTHAYAYLHAGRPVLFIFDPGIERALRIRSDLIDVVHACPAEPFVLPIDGEVELPHAILVRPDGYIAWAGDPREPSLAHAAKTWFGESAMQGDPET